MFQFAKKNKNRNKATVWETFSKEEHSSFIVKVLDKKWKKICENIIQHGSENRKTYILQNITQFLGKHCADSCISDVQYPFFLSIKLIPKIMS